MRAGARACHKTLMISRFVGANVGAKYHKSLQASDLI